MRGATLLARADRLSGVETKRAATVAIVVGVVLDVRLGRGVHCASQNQAPCFLPLSVHLNLEALL